MDCQYCGFKNESVGAKFCSGCGRKLLKNQETEGFKEPLVKNSVNATDSGETIPAYGSYVQSHIVEPVIPNNQEQKQDYKMIIVKKCEYLASCDNGSNYRCKHCHKNICGSHAILRMVNSSMGRGIYRQTRMGTFCPKCNEKTRSDQQSGYCACILGVLCIIVMIMVVVIEYALVSN
eukprot:29105_1